MAEAILRLPVVKARTGLSRTEIYRREAIGEFPKRVTIGPRSVGWVETEITCWVRARIRARGRNGEKIARPGETQSAGT